MKYLLDANTIIFILTRQRPQIRERMAACEEGDFVTSSIAFAEVALGSARGKPSPTDMLDQFVRFVPVLDFDAAAARAYAQLPFKRGSFDRLIAAHALSADLTLISNNEADFADVTGLRVEDWTV